MTTLEHTPIRPEFASRKLNAAGLIKVDEAREILSYCLNELERVIPDIAESRRHLALVRTKMEEAGFNAIKAISLSLAHQEDA